MKKVILKIINRLGYDLKKRPPDNVDNICLNVQPKEKPIGRALLSYVLEPFLLNEGEAMPNAHTHYWESYTIGNILLNLGYELDVVSYRNYGFKPQKQYSVFLGARTNFEKIARHMNKDCLKIVHLDTAHWLFNNYAQYQRTFDLMKRKGVGLENRKIVENNRAIEFADCATILGNKFTIETYQFAQKKIFRIPISTCATYEFPEDKHIGDCRRNFVWFGSDGLVHKGLDLVLDAFSGMPDYHLYVCGPVKDEPHFEEAYYHELYQLPNIHTLGWVDINGPTFLEVMNKCLALIYPSCSEGGGGSVIQCMHAGVIPIVSYESSVDIKDEVGMMLETCSTKEITDCVKKIASLPEAELDLMSRKSWEFAIENHSRERFAHVFERTIKQLIRQRSIMA